MSIIHVNQIRAYLKSEYETIIDISDRPDANDEQKENMILSRALASYALSSLADVDKNVINQYIVDGFDDNGIDAFFFDEDQSLLYIVQAKWHNDGNGSISKGDNQNFLTGIKDLFNSNFDRFNARLNQHKIYLESAINSSDTKLVIVIAHTGTQELSAHVQRDLNDFLAEINNPTEVCQLKVLKQGEIHSSIANASGGAPIDLEIMINNWGMFNQPYTSYYGSVDAAQIAGWWEDYSPRIFAPNIRVFLGSSDVNKELEITLEDKPENFFYFNNGITILCNSVDKTRAGGNRRDSGVFVCKGVAVVNGAQTVGTIGKTFQNNPSQVEQASVHVKIISLTDCPDDFDKFITKAANTQNRIESRDFVSQDENQSRIQAELAIEHIHYSYKKGDNITDKDNGFTFEEAVVARACSSGEINYSTIAKGQVSRLWSDTGKAPYIRLFNNSLLGPQLWKLVQVQRVIDDEIAKLSETKERRKKMHLIHGNRFLAFQIYRVINIQQLIQTTIDFNVLRSDVNNKLNDIFEQSVSLIDDNYHDPMLAYFFKNQTKCADISNKITL